MTKIKPLGNRLLVRRSKATAAEGKILLPESAQKKQNEGEVIAVGPGKMADSGKIEPLTVKKGDRVLFGAYAGTEVKEEGEEYLILSEDDILGILP